MSDEQLISLRRIFQAIDSANNGSITPASLTSFYQEVRSRGIGNRADKAHTNTPFNLSIASLQLSY